MVIRISSICFLLTILCSLLYAGWVEADRFFNARTFILNQVQRDHGVRLKLEKTEVKGKSILIADKSEVALGSHGSGFLEGIRVENRKLFISRAQLQVFDDNPWLWVVGLCGEGTQVQVQIDQLNVKTSLGKTYVLGKFEISTSANYGIKGECELFTIEQWGEKSSQVSGNLTELLPAFEKGLSTDFIKFSPAKTCREINGIGLVNIEITEISSLVFQVKRPVTVAFTWNGKEAKGFLQKEGLDLEIKLTPEATTISGFGRGSGYEWYGQISSEGEQYQLFVEGLTLSEILKSGFKSNKYKIPDLGVLSGACELKRETKNNRLQLIEESKNKKITIDEELH